MTCQDLTPTVYFLSMASVFDPDRCILTKSFEEVHDEGNLPKV